MTSIIAMTFIVLVTTSNAYAQVSDFYWSETIDWNAPGIGGQVYTADTATKTITQLTDDDSGFARIDDVEIDSVSNQLFWNNWASGFFNSSPAEGIYKSNLDGTGQIQVTGLAQSSSSALGAAGHHGIALDPVNQDIYFTRGVSYANDISLGEVSKVKFDGSGYTKLDAAGDSWFPSGIALDANTNTLYWGQPGFPFGAINGAINSMDTSGGSKMTLAPHTDGQGRSLALDNNNGLIFYSSWNPLIPFSGGGIWVYDINTGIVTNVLPVNRNNGIPDVELDTANMRIYWTEFTNGQIQSADYDASGNLSNITTELDGLENPFGLALGLITNQSPECGSAAASQNTLWPPNHKMKDITILGVTDADDDSITITIDGITQDEPVNDTGDGDTSPDGLGVGTDTAQIRAERSGTGDGRVYEISFTADDGNEGTCSGSVQVGVPHDKNSTPINSGTTIDSTQ